MVRSWLLASVWYTLFAEWKPLGRLEAKLDKAYFTGLHSDAGILFPGSHRLIDFGENDQDEKASFPSAVVQLLVFC
jgi:hypothetical protein